MATTLTDRKVFVLQWWLDGEVVDGVKSVKVPKSNVGELNNLLADGWRPFNENDVESDGPEDAMVLFLYREKEVTA